MKGKGLINTRFQKIELYIAGPPPFPPLPRLSDDTEQEKWDKSDATARAISGFTLSDDYLEHVRGCATAAEMW